MQLNELHCFFYALLAVATLLVAARTSRGIATEKQPPCLADDDPNNNHSHDGYNNTLPVHNPI